MQKKNLVLKTPSLGLKEGIDDYFDKVTASQREANMAARGVTETEQASSIDRSQPQSSTDYFDAPQHSLNKLLLLLKHMTQQ